MEILGKTAVFPGGYGLSGEILHGRIWPNWGPKGQTVIAIELILSHPVVIDTITCP